ncbi:MAG: hypothetical protein QNJ22_13500 [Desulfosarcinaceae bacterium]|nr:hypothetical protein [Desulfosarcinaceae bacterium]
MEAHEKKLAAALAAVSAYIQTEEEALLLPPPVKPIPRQSKTPNLWGMGGRQEIMQMRSLMQLKGLQRR